jgi:hypothetical protein
MEITSNIPTATDLILLLTDMTPWVPPQAVYNTCIPHYAFAALLSFSSPEEF